MPEKKFRYFGYLKMAQIGPKWPKTRFLPDFENQNSKIKNREQFQIPFDLCCWMSCLPKSTITGNCSRILTLCTPPLGYYGYYWFLLIIAVITVVTDYYWLLLDITVITGYYWLLPVIKVVTGYYSY